MKEIIRIVLMILAMILSGHADVEEPAQVELDMPGVVVLDSPLPTPLPIPVPTNAVPTPPMINPSPTPPLSAVIGTIEAVPGPIPGQPTSTPAPTWASEAGISVLPVFVPVTPDNK